MKCRNGHESPEDASFCQECGVSLRQQSAEDKAREEPVEPVQPVQTEEEREQNALRDKYTQPVGGSDVGRFFKKISPKQWLITIGAAVAIVVAIAVGASVGGGSGSAAMDSSKVEQKVIGLTVDDGTTVTTAVCASVHVNNDGYGQYTCANTFSDNTQYSQTANVDSSGEVTLRS